MNSKLFQTKSEVIFKEMPEITTSENKTLIAIDDGYSGVKGVSPNKMFAFPIEVLEVEEEPIFVAKAPEDTYTLRDNTTGHIYLVGKNAINAMNSQRIKEIEDSSKSKRERYYTPEYKIPMLMGIILGLRGIDNPGEILLQTGLPMTYKSDGDYVIDSMKGDYDLDVRFGSNAWENYKFTLKPENIFVIPQPMGSLMNCVFDDQGGVIEEGSNLAKANSIILDIGFGTEDVFDVIGTQIQQAETYTNTGMGSVFEEVAKKITEETKQDIKVFEMQKYLGNGIYKYYDAIQKEPKSYDFSQYLENVNKAKCELSLDRLIERFDGLQSHSYLIVTGGTGDSRLQYIIKRLENFDIKVVPSNQYKQSIPMIYSNVLGYYLFRYHAINDAAVS